MMGPYPVRKNNRLQCYDYASPGIYFVTICTQNRRCLLGRVVDDLETPLMQLSACGEIVDQAIREIPLHYPAVKLLQHCVMPNHVHLLLELQAEAQNPTLSWMVNQLKGAVSKRIGSGIWQKSFHDHVVRDEQEFQKIWEYICYNPAKWKTDGYFVANEAGGQ